MKNLFLLTPLFFLSLNLWANDVKLTQQGEYLQIKPYLDLLNINGKNVQTWRENLAKVDFYEEVLGGHFKMQRAGKWQDEIRIETKHITLIIPEWCLLIYLQEIENQELSKENKMKGILNI